MGTRERPFLEQLPLARQQRWLGYVFATLLVGVGWWGRWALGPAFPTGYPYITFFPAVIIAAFLFGRGPGTFAAIAAGLLAWYFFIPPVNGFTVSRGTAIALAFYGGAAAVNIAMIDWMQRSNGHLRREQERCEELAAQTKLLFSELQHRVSNNLQMVGAVLALQRGGITDPAARQALSDAAGKLQTIGRIQRQLYDHSGAPLALGQLLPDLTRDLIETAGRPGISWKVEVDQDVQLPPDAAIPIALIVAEAIANAVEHGFAGNGDGIVVVRGAQAGDIMTLTVEDDGVGPPPDFDAATAMSLGLRITRTLAEQLDGSFDLARGERGGAVATLRFPLPCPDARV